MKKKKITMTIDGDVFANFKKYCKRNGMKVSSRVELLIEKNLMEDSKERRGSEK